MVNYIKLFILYNSFYTVNMKNKGIEEYLKTWEYYVNKWEVRLQIYRLWFHFYLKFMQREKQANEETDS